MARRELLSRENPTKLHAIIDERVLSCQFSGTEALLRQLRHLLKAAAQPNITIQVVPTDVGLHPRFNGSFVVLNYDHEPSLVWLENKIPSIFLDEEEQIKIYTHTWDELCALAYNTEKSVDFISAISAQLDRKIETIMNMITEPSFNNALWRKGSRSSANSNCVEVAVTTGWVGVRDSKNRQGNLGLFLFPVGKIRTKHKTRKFRSVNH